MIRAWILQLVSFSGIFSKYENCLVLVSQSPKNNFQLFMHSTLTALVGMFTNTGYITQLQVMRERDENNCLVPTTCEMDHLRLHCITRRIPARELYDAVMNSLKEVFNGGNNFGITPQTCNWINHKVPHLQPQLATLPAFSKCIS